MINMDSQLMLTLQQSKANAHMTNTELKQQPEGQTCPMFLLNECLDSAANAARLSQSHILPNGCSDVHGDMSAMVLSLRWPATSLNQAFETVHRTPPPKGKIRSPEQQAASERAQHRWGQIKMLYVEFHRARR